MKRLLSSLVIGAVLLNAGMAAAETAGASSVKVKKTHRLWKKKSAQVTTTSPGKSY